MRNKIVLVIFFLLLLVVLVVLSRENPPHAFKECSSCHGLAAPAGKAARSLTAPVSMLCIRCHARIFSEGFLHPVDVIPQGVAIPPDMPLSASGALTCATCHDVHAEAVTPYGASTFFLRRREERREF